MENTFDSLPYEIKIEIFKFESRTFLNKIFSKKNSCSSGLLNILSYLIQNNSKISIKKKAIDSWDISISSKKDSCEENHSFIILSDNIYIKKILLFLVSAKNTSSLKIIVSKYIEDYNSLLLSNIKKLSIKFISDEKVEDLDTMKLNISRTENLEKLKICSWIPIKLKIETKDKNPFKNVKFLKYSNIYDIEGITSNKFFRLENLVIDTYHYYLYKHKYYDIPSLKMIVVKFQSSYDRLWSSFTKLKKIGKEEKIKFIAASCNKMIINSGKFIKRKKESLNISVLLIKVLDEKVVFYKKNINSFY